MLCQTPLCTGGYRLVWTTLSAPWTGTACCVLVGGWVSLHTWNRRRLLARIDDGSSIGNLLESATYCAHRLARYGADFRSLLPPIFEQRVLSLLEGRWSAAAQLFYSDVSGWDWAYRVSLLGHRATPGDRGAAAGATNGVCVCVRVCVCVWLFGFPCPSHITI